MQQPVDKPDQKRITTLDILRKVALQILPPTSHIYTNSHNERHPAAFALIIKLEDFNKFTAFAEI